MPNAPDEFGSVPVLLTGDGPAWPPLPDPVPPAPKWINGRAFPAVWRDSLTFTVGALHAVTTPEFETMRPGRPWNHRPEPGSDADVEQAIAAKVHLGMRMLPLLAMAQVALIEPAFGILLPDWDDEDDPSQYAAGATLPEDPLFLDFEGLRGEPIAWEAETWPLPFHLRAALCWRRDGLLNIIPFGSVGGSHPWGGTDYQAWARWVFLDSEEREWPDPGPGDFITRPSGLVRPWVDAEGESVCAQQGAVTNNLSVRVLRLLSLLEAVGGSLEAPSLPRSSRRRANREGQRIALVPEGLPDLKPVRPSPGASDDDPDPVGAPCPLPTTHRRLQQAHVLWHEALVAYHDPDEFVTKLNATIVALRNTSWMLQKELRHVPGFDEWYEARQEEMRADGRMKWLKQARNKIEKQGDLDTSSVARIQVVAGWREVPIHEREVDPTATAEELVRGLTLTGLAPDVSREGFLQVERRWTVPEWPGDELLDLLAHCHGKLAELITAAHKRFGSGDEICELAADDICPGAATARHPSGRLSCMVATRAARTARRDLSTGAPYSLEVATVERDIDQLKEAAQHYSDIDYGPPMPNDAGVLEQAARLHDWGRQMLLVDGAHVTIAWLLVDGVVKESIQLNPGNRRDKVAMMEQLAEEVARCGATAVILTTEAWTAPALPADHPDAMLPAGEREDRTEVLLTHAFEFPGVGRTWCSPMRRVGGRLELDHPMEEEVGEWHQFLNPVRRVWDSWPSGRGAAPGG